MTALVAPAVSSAAVGPSRGEVQLHELSKRYATVPAVRDLSLHVQAGEFLAVLGPSGCGKSTTLRVLAGLEAPDSGTVWMSGLDVTGVPAHRRDVHTVFQSYALFPHLSVSDNIAFPLRQRGVGSSELRRRVGEALELVHLAGAGQMSVTSLSGGQQQRVALARAIVDRPAVLLLDEPLSALDRSLRQAMQVELRLVQQELGVTTILVTHDHEEALSLADRILVMDCGRAEQVGSAEEVYDCPESLVVARFVGEQNEFSGTGDGRSHVDANGVVLRAAGPAPTGSAVALVRPEHVRVEPVADPDTGLPDAKHRLAGQVNCVAGVVRGASIAGISTAVLVECADDTVLARVPRDGRAAPRVGDVVVCSWDPTNVLLFPTPDKGST